MAALLGISSIVWIVIIAVPEGWHEMNLLWLVKLRIGLYQINVEKDVVAHGAVLLASLAGVKVPKWADDLLTSSHSLRDMQDRFCTGVIPVLGSACDDFKSLYWGSTLMIVFTSINVVLHWLALGMLLNFFHANATQMGFNVIRITLIFIPMLACLATMIYGIMAAGFGDMDGIHWGPCYFIAMILCLLSFIPLTVFQVCIVPMAEKLINCKMDVKAARELEADQGMRQSMNHHGSHGGKGGPPQNVQMSSYPQQQQGGYGGGPNHGWPPPNQGYGQQPGYGGPPQGGYGGPPQGGYGGPPQGGYGGGYQY